MKKLVLFLLLTSPLLAFAQVDDMYFVPKKEKKVLVVKSAEEIYMVDEVDSIGYVDEYADEYVDEAETAYFTNDLYDVVDDYTYSTRIVRFQSPNRLFSTNLYWDLKYSCGINDWLVYDNGYSVYIYPTANNIFYNDPYYYNRVNIWNWNTYHSWHYPYYSHNHWWNCHYHNDFWHKPHYGYHGSHNISWKPSNRKPDIPTNGSIIAKQHREQPVRTTAGSSTSRREQPVRTTAGNSTTRREQQVRTTTSSSNPRREQQVRGGNVRSGSSATSSRQYQSRTSVNSSNAKRSSTSNGNGVGRSSGNSSGGYSRPSSTGVSRSSGSSGSGSRSSSGSSYSSGSSRSSSGSSYSSGSSRSSSSGSSRSSGSRR